MRPGIRSGSWAIRPAVPKDYAAIEKLLKASHLPVQGVKKHLREFVVMVLNSRVIGTVGLEIYGNKALLRSLGVSENHRNQGFGRSLVQAVLARAMEMGIDELFLLTQTARAYFYQFGFQVVPRESVDETVKSSIEFRSVCPASAVCMRLGIK